MNEWDEWSSAKHSSEQDASWYIVSSRGVWTQHAQRFQWLWNSREKENVRSLSRSCGQQMSAEGSYMFLYILYRKVKNVSYIFQGSLHEELSEVTNVSYIFGPWCGGVRFDISTCEPENVLLHFEVSIVYTFESWILCAFFQNFQNSSVEQF